MPPVAVVAGVVLCPPPLRLVHRHVPPVAVRPLRRRSLYHQRRLPWTVEKMRLRGWRRTHAGFCHVAKCGGVDEGGGGTSWPSHATYGGACGGSDGGGAREATSSATICESWMMSSGHGHDHLASSSADDAAMAAADVAASSS
jgi:hypothetical protein